MIIILCFMYVTIKLDKMANRPNGYMQFECFLFFFPSFLDRFKRMYVTPLWFEKSLLLLVENKFCKPASRYCFKFFLFTCI